ncbi:hypothetical protein, partial [Xanthomonas hortorum]
RRWAGKDQSRGSVCKVQASHNMRCSDNGSTDQHPKQVKHQANFQQNNLQTSWCGVLADCGTMWRHGCRH